MAEKLDLFMLDDDPADIEIVRRHIESFIDLPVHLTPFTDPRSFQEAFPACKADIIFLDYLLAGGNDGLSMLKWIKSACTSPVIVLTGHGDERIAVEIMRAGADDYLIKSDLTADSLRRAIRDTLGRVRLQNEKKTVEEALKSSEERYRNVVEMAGDGIAIVQDRNLAYVNPRLAQMMGYPREQLLNKRFIDYFPHNELAKVAAIHVQRDRGLAADRVFELSLLHKGGRRVEAEVSARRILSSGRPAAMFIIRDISERKNILKRILAAKRAAEKANRAKSDFLSVISHELRTPLTSILGFTELLMQREDRRLSPQSREDFNTILRNGRHLLHLIDEILDFKKIEAGRMEIRPAPLSLKGLVREAVRTITPLVGKKRIRLTTVLPPRLPPVVTDGLRLRQVLINLLENSLKFTEKGRLRLAVQPVKLPGDSVTITIRDTGIGIPRNKLKSIFRKFEQGEAGPTRRYGGAGLGLTISRSIMRSLGGDITVKSTPRKGSEFRVTLPLHPVPAGARKKKRKAIP